MHKYKFESLVNDHNDSLQNLNFSEQYASQFKANATAELRVTGRSNIISHIFLRYQTLPTSYTFLAKAKYLPLSMNENKFLEKLF